MDPNNAAKLRKKDSANIIVVSLEIRVAKVMNETVRNKDHCYMSIQYLL